VERGRQPFGFVNAFKPPGPSSTRFGSWVRALLGTGAVGHWGTLDPAACGVLVLAVGAASRLLPYLEPTEKSYAFELRVGARTDSADATGKIVETAAVDSAWVDRLHATVPQLLGALDQRAPMFSAVKIGGKPLYKRARAGETETDRLPRTVRIRSLRVLGTSDTAARLAVTCSAGTYVRTLCEQIGERIGLPAHCGMLIRTAAGPFSLSDSALPGQLARDARSCLVDPLAVLSMPRVALDKDQVARFVHGLRSKLAQTAEDATVLAVSEGSIVGVGQLCSGMLHPKRVLIGPSEGSMHAEANV
jgi:tRNA pseudouridine55 synthase